MRLLLATALSLALPSGLLAAGSDDSNPPKTVHCSTGEVYDEGAKKCVETSHHNMDTDSLYAAVRTLAYQERYREAQDLLADMPQDDDRTLTYLGFTHRKMGNIDTAMTYYSAALARNPGNILARSYMGQGMVADGHVSAALEQLRAIREYGGKGTWAEASLRTAIASGRTFNY
ncbi:hypothetical protein [Sulfitobacter sp. S190]|uniref:tetratricopeptide repeat protein n=1 Tax=Sulfitobacter sp. S190 TaxID=2867022 RepID=UPI0021A2657F|nr:hypothetical protein [Sulfitobacter sp. S190]UWR21313.1 hypothetical protein K3756_11390 [Sulfitobacter sp. S190]